MNILMKLCGVRSTADRSETFVGMMAGFCPLLLPFLVLTCSLRWEMWATAVVWSLMIVPGVLAMNAFVPVGHVMGFPPGRFAMGSLLGLLPFAFCSWVGCIFHVTLGTVLCFWGVLYLLCVSLLVWRLMRTKDEGFREPLFREQYFRIPRLWGVPVVAGGILILVGVAVALIATWSTKNNPNPPSYRAYWLTGVCIGMAGSILAGVGVVLGRLRRKGASEGDEEGNTHEKDSGHLFVWLLRIGVFGLVILMMRLSFAYPPDLLKRPYNPGWNSDDVTYVSQAVDYRYGKPLGMYEPSVGTERKLGRVDWSPFIAPLVATLSYFSGVECAALHHSVLPPFVWLLGASGLALAIGVTFQRDYWLFPLAMIVCLVLICKGMVQYPKGLAYDRCFAEFSVLRAMQTKSVHLLWIWPLQWAVLLGLAKRPSIRMLFLAVAVAYVGHLVHPFSTILGAVWVAIIFVVSLFLDRRAVLFLLVLGIMYGLLGGTYKALVHRGEGNGISSGRTQQSEEEMRDLLTDDEGAIPRQDPVVLFGMNPLFLLAVCGIPLAIAIGLREREMLYLAAVGIVSLLMTNTVWFGSILNSALPTSILWRGKWLLPYFPLIAVTVCGLFRGFCVLMQPREGHSSGKRSFLASILAGGAILFSASQWDTMAFMTPGKTPETLTKFSSDVHGLVDVLGGVEASPFVWAPRTVTRELPQIMPNVQLVMSRTKIIRPAEREDYRNLVKANLNAFAHGAAKPQWFQILCQQYPIDTVILDAKVGNDPLRMIEQLGWEPVASSGRYRIYKRKHTPTETSSH